MNSFKLPPSKLISGQNGNQPNGTTEKKFITPLYANAIKHHTVFDGNSFTNLELAQAEQISNQVGMKAPPAQVAAIIKLVSPNAFAHLQIIHKQTISHDSENVETSLLSDRKKKLRKEINNLANRLANLQNVKFEAIHKRWIVEKGGNSNANSTFPELQQKYDWLKAEIIRIQQNRSSKRK